MNPVSLGGCPGLFVQSQPQMEVRPPAGIVSHSCGCGSSPVLTAAWPPASEATHVLACLCPLMSWAEAISGRHVLQTDQQSRKCPFSLPQLDGEGGGRGVSAPPPSLWSPHRGCLGLRWRCPPPALCVVSPENRYWRQSRYKRWWRLGRGPADHTIEAHAEKMRDKDQKPRQLFPVSKDPPICHSRPSSPGRVRVPLDSKIQAKGDSDRKGQAESLRMGGANYCV